MSENQKATSELLLNRALDPEACQLRVDGCLTSSRLHGGGWNSVIAPMLEPDGTLTGPYIASTLEDGSLPDDLVGQANLFHVAAIPNPFRHAVLQELWYAYPAHYMMLAAHLACFHVKHGPLHDALLRTSATVAYEHYIAT